MILVSFFSEDVLSDEIKYAIVSNIKVTKIERSAFLGGHPVYVFQNDKHNTHECLAYT